MSSQIRKRILTGVLSLAIVVSGLVCLQSKEVQAEETDSRVYVEVEKSVFENYITNKQAPSKDNYLFAGWIARKSDGTGVAIESKNDSILSEEGVTITAKFIPAHLAGVACQVKANTYDKDVTQTELRIVSVVDNGKYKTFGYNLYKRVLNEGTTDEYTETQLCGYDATGEKANAAETLDRYSGLYVYKDSTSGERSIKEPTDIFGADATGFYFTTVKIGPIPSSVYDSCIFVIRPYWITADGTYVEGMAEFDRVSDGKNGIANISVNIKEAEAIAAGRMTIKYNSVDYTYNGADRGRVFEEMEINASSVGEVKCVGNVKDIKQNSENPEDVFVNLRFKKNTTVTAGTSTFEIINTEFCDKDETTETPKVWNVKF